MLTLASVHKVLANSPMVFMQIIFFQVYLSLGDGEYISERFVEGNIPQDLLASRATTVTPSIDEVARSITNACLGLVCLFMLVK